MEIARRAGDKCWICQEAWFYDENEKKYKCPVCGMGRGSWTSPQARLSPEEALQRLEQGKNVGIAARHHDPLVIIDIDSYKFLDQMPDTLVVRSRKRFGLHGFCFTKEKKRNIPTENGELRSSDQYVVAAGSYVSTTKEGLIKEMEEQNIPKEIQEEILQDRNLGVYTVEKAKPPITISYEELPRMFLEQVEKNKKQEKAVLKTATVKLDGEHSALFDLTIHDVVSTSKPREKHPFHISETGQNFSISGDLAHCWRHTVSLNALQFLVVKSGYMSCLEAGTPHKNKEGDSKVKGDDGAIFWAWRQAKKDGIIPADDKIPIRAMNYIAVKHGLIQNANDQLPPEVYNKVLKIVEEEY